MIYRAGNIVDDDADLLVNTVNTVGVMGAGVARAFRSKWPTITIPYVAACNNGSFGETRCLLFDLPDGRKWAALATKNHWRDLSEYEWVKRGLETLADLAHGANIKSIAIPPPGCGNGGLKWKRVHPMVVNTLRGFDLRIYGPPV